VADFASDADPELWRRYLALILDGLRAAPGASGPLPGPPLDAPRLDAAMSGWRPRRH
jgi:hypothetical protein